MQNDDRVGLVQPLARPSISTLLGTTLKIASEPDALMWGYLTRRFKAFLENIALTDKQVEDGETKYKGVVSCLNAAYWGQNCATSNSFLIGSWAKGTRIRPPRDVDLYFVLPVEAYHRFEAYQGNKQSALLQEVKSKLLATYPDSTIKGDGPVVIAAFRSYSVEIVPAFPLTDERAYYVCDTKDGGKYIVAKPLHEVDAIEAGDARNNRNLRRLIQMLKCWQAYCSVPLRSYYLELLALEFLDQCTWRHQSYFYYDWICRDFFAWLVGKANSFLIAPGTFEIMWIGDEWKTRAESAYARASKAEQYERVNDMENAGDEWQKIFGTDIPKYV
jgi:hypothetical protein